MSLASKKAEAKTKIENLLDDMLTKEDPATGEYADRLIDALEDWLKEASIKYTSGLVAPNGAVTGTFVGTLE